MDVRDGRIYQDAVANGLLAEDRKYLEGMKLHPTPFQRAAGLVGRNDPCPCGSQKKFKKCCLGKAK